MITPEDKPTLFDGPRWRFELIQATINHHQTIPRSEKDHALRVGYQYLLRYRDAKCHDRHRRLKAVYPHLYKAHCLRENEDSERWQIEAAIVANVPPAEIGQYVAQHEDTIKAYETYFYDIRGKLGSPGYIQNRVFMPAIKHGLDGRDYDFMMKALAYTHGWEVAKAFIGGGTLTPDVRQVARQMMEDDLLRTTCHAVKSLDINKYTGLKVIELGLKLKEIEVQHGSNVAQEEASKIWGLMLENCATTVLPSYEYTQDPKLLLSDEPRVKELLGGPAVEPYIKPVQGVTS